MARELGRDETRGGVIVGQVAQHGDTLVIAGVGVAFAEYDLRAGLVQFGAKHELPGLALGPAALLPANGPAGDHLRITRDIGLRVAAADT